MRYVLFVFLLPFSALLPVLPTSAADAPPPVERSNASQEFWTQAEQLVQQQLNLINRIEQAIASPNVNQSVPTATENFDG